MRVAIIGAGPAGVATALALLRQALISDVIVYESKPEVPASESTVRGYGISLHPNGLRAVETMCPDLLAEIISGATAFASYRTISLSDAGIYTADENSTEVGNVSHYEDTYGYAQYGIRWQFLRDTIARYAQKAGCDIKYGHTVKSIEEDSDGITIHMTDAEGKECSAKADLLVGADGLNSVARSYVIGEEEGPPRELGTTFVLGIAENKNVPTKIALAKGASHAASIKSVDGSNEVFALMMPVGDKFTYWALSFVGEERRALLEAEALKGSDSLKSFLLEKFSNMPQLCDLIQASSAGEMFLRRSRDRLPISSFRRGPRCVLVGDAAHPVRPTNGFGVNLALEDAVELALSLKPLADEESSCSNPDVPNDGLSKKLDAALARFDDLRVKRCYTMQEQSVSLQQKDPEAVKKMFAHAFSWRPPIV